MREWAKRITIPQALKDEIKHEQGCRCILCGKVKPFNKLQIHHKKPVCHFLPYESKLAAKRENLCAICTGCHPTADHYALTERVYIDELIEMREDEEYVLTT